MNRYHKDVFTKPDHWQTLEALTDHLNGLAWAYSRHCLDSIKTRAIDLEALLIFIKGLKLNISQIFEYYLDDKDRPEKICYRISYISGLDIILVIAEDKEIITIYLNSQKDKHETLRKEQYING